MRLFQFLSLCLLSLTLSALDAHADKRVALVIGNGAYRNVPALPNPTNDAADVGAALKRSGFEPIVATDLDQSAMQEAVLRFAREAHGADVALFYYSGHALQFAGVNYLVPVDAVVRDEVDLRRLVRADEILADLQQAKNLRILVLDACRDNPFADELRRNVGQGRGVTVSRGLAKMESPDGTIISYATQAGRTADDGDGRNSPYTSSFLEHIRDQGNINTVFQTISAGVYQRTKGTQVPELSLSFFGEYYLNGKPETSALAPAPAPPIDPCADAGDHWRSAETLGTLAAFKDQLMRFPNCAFADLAKSRIAALAKSADDAKHSIAFDGTWIGKERCQSQPPFLESYYQHALRIKDGVLHAVFGDDGKPGSSVYDGKIEADGSATIMVKGLLPENDPLRRPAGSPYQYKIVLALKDSSGAGVRTETPRQCQMELTKLAPQSPGANPAQTDSKRTTQREEKTAVIPPEQRDGGKPRQTGGLSCSMMRSRCATACVGLSGNPNCASTVCPRLEGECMSSGCWRGRGFSGCGLAKR
ncbi:caspase family protein [Bradyrhizobium sp. USDA 4486]